LENTKLTTLLNHFPFDIWKYHTPLAWYEQENLGHKAHIEALPPALWVLLLYSFKGRLQRPSKLGEVETSIVHIAVCNTAAGSRNIYEHTSLAILTAKHNLNRSERMCGDLFSPAAVKVNMKCRIFLSDFNQIWDSRQIFS
jgi:hypothetical protein